MCLLMKDHNTTYSLAKRIEAESDPTSGSNCQFAGNSEECLELRQEYQSAEPKQWEPVGQKAQILYQIHCKEKKGMEGENL